MRLLLALAVLIATSFSASAAIPRERFFAQPATQALHPAAFALSPGALPFLEESEALARTESAALVAAIRADASLMAAIAGYEALSLEAKIAALKKIFALEIGVMGVAAPVLEIGAGVTPNGAFFEFDLTKPGPGKVQIDPTALDDSDGKLESLALLIHETRHSSQLQRAFGFEKEARPALAAGYLAAFAAQKELAGKLVFCDFLTLLNEYEAFRFGNTVVRELSAGRFQMEGMGTYASQFDSSGRAKIDLAALHRQGVNVLEEFNRLEEPQFEFFNR